MLITSAKNPKIKRVCSLRERRERDREGVTVLEGYRELSRSMDAPVLLASCWRSGFLPQTARWITCQGTSFGRLWFRNELYDEK